MLHNTNEIRATLEAAGVIALQSAARTAGLKFRNGDLNKGQIVDRLMNYPAMASAAVAVLKREGMNNPPVFQRKPGSPVNINDWDDDEETPAPTPAPAPSPDIGPLRQSIDTILRAIGDIQRAGYITRAEMGQAIAATAPSIVDSVLRAVIEAAKAGKIPGIGETHIHFPPPAPEIKVEGLTHPKLPDLIRILRAGENAFLVGPAGSGKTTAAKQAREALAASFSREDYQVFATGAVSDGFALLGYKNAAGEYVRTAFRDAVEFGHLFLFDEVDASAADALLVVNALDNGFIAFPDATIPVHPHFRLIAGGNTDGSGATMEYSGRTRMDGAFRDRFAILDWNLDPRIEAHLSRGDSLWLEAMRSIRAFALSREIMDVVATSRAVRRGPLFLHEGMERMRVLEVTCKRGALSECWTDVLRLPAVAAFLRG